MHRKIHKKKLRWYGNILWGDEDHTTRRVLEMEVEGSEREEKKGKSTEKMDRLHENGTGGEAAQSAGCS